ncbi:MAG: NAD(P)/FAD-dependent oxidoreductase [Acidimicrobiales bacterium]
MNNELTTDYLVVGSGAVGMAFADVLVTETDADIVIVDRFAKPGGHWNVAYPFVTLHQPSQFYGVSSVELSKGVVDQVGLNKGLGDLATGAEVSAYFDSVMRHQFLPSGRVRYYPMCDYTGDGTFRHKLTGERFHVQRTKTVDCTYLNTSVPATHTPSFEVGEGVRFMPLNDLPTIEDTPAGYVVIGGGKTGIDAILWLLEHRVDPDMITWIVSRDAWLLNRKNTQPATQFFSDTMGSQAAQFESIANASSSDDMFLRLEASGYFLRLDPNVWPTMFHGATISEPELAELRRLKNVVRLGHVQHISPTDILLDRGTVPTTPDHLFIDCSASAITNLEMKPIFQGDLITPQTVRSYQPVFSAALIAHVEATRDSEDEKNALCAVVPLPNSNLDYMKLTLAFMTNQYNWGQDPEVREWLLNNRLDGFSKLVSEVSRDDREKRAILKRLRDSAMPAAVRLTELIAEADATDRD